MRMIDSLADEVSAHMRAKNLGFENAFVEVMDLQGICGVARGKMKREIGKILSHRRRCYSSATPKSPHEYVFDILQQSANRVILLVPYSGDEVTFVRDRTGGVLQSATRGTPQAEVVAAARQVAETTFAKFA